MKKTKIICTMGPSTDDPGLLLDMIRAGMDLARFNFSHGDHASHKERLEMVRAAAEKAGKPVAMICDTKGPEMRLGLFEGGRAELENGKEFVLTTESVKGTAAMASVNYEGLPAEVQPGNKILLADGMLILEVTKIEGPRIYTVVRSGGEISDRKRVACPGVELKMPFLSKQDESDILFAAENGMDYVAASFVQNADNVFAIRRLLETNGYHLGIISKIENHAGLEHIEDIIKASDGIMVARGDLGVEIPAEVVPLWQKKIIHLCNAAGKPVVTATQMLESMTNSARCTRAEASDVANSIFDGTDAIMLSGETASGAYPREAVQTMARIAERTEQALDYINVFKHKGITERIQTTDAISHATVQIATELDANVILSITESGYTARMVAKYRPHAQVVAVSSLPETLRRMTLYWGVTPLYGPNEPNTDKLIDSAMTAAQNAGLVRKGDSVVVTAGKDVGKVGSTNLIQVINVGHQIVKGLGIGKRAVSGPVCKIRTKEDLKKLKPGMIIVVSALENEMGAVASQASGIIAEEGGFTSSAAIIGINCGIPVVVGANGAMDKLEDGDVVTLDVEAGAVYAGKINVK